MIEIKNISKYYVGKDKKKFFALNDISFLLGDNEVISLLGHNGAGKTTLIKCLSTLLYPSNGVIEFNGVDIYQNISSYRKQISYLLGGEKGLYNRLTGRENVEYLSALKGMFRKDIHNKIEYYFEALEIREFMDERVETYSRGMKQKIHLINALITNSSVIFLDEPTSGMDPISAEKTRAFIKRAAKEKNRTILITSHMMNEVEALSDRIIILFQGNKKFDGDIEFFKNSITKEVICNCRLAKTERSKELIQLLKKQFGLQNEYRVQNDQLLLTITGNTSEEIVEKYIKYLAEVILDISFQKPSLESTYIKYISNLEKTERISE